MTTALLPIQFPAPLLPVPPSGLYQATTWAEQSSDTQRWLPTGVVIRPVNYGFESGFGIWGESWSADPNDITTEKHGDRPDISNLQPFTALTVYGLDHNYVGDLREIALQEVRDRAARNLARGEQQAVEIAVAARLLDDAGPPATAANILDAIAALEARFAQTQTIGVIHAGAQWATPALATRTVSSDGAIFRTAMGHQIVFGGGYVDALGSTLVASSPVFGWRGAVFEQENTHHGTNQFIALAERNVLIGYESAVAAVHIN